MKNKKGNHHTQRANDSHPIITCTLTSWLRTSWLRDEAPIRATWKVDDPPPTPIEEESNEPIPRATRRPQEEA